MAPKKKQKVNNQTKPVVVVAQPQQNVPIPNLAFLFSKLYNEQQDLFEEVLLYLDAPSLLKLAMTSTTLYYYLLMPNILIRILKSRPFILKHYGHLISFSDLCTTPHVALAFLSNHDYMNRHCQSLKTYFESKFPTTSSNSEADVYELFKKVQEKNESLILPPCIVQWFLTCKNFGVYQGGLCCRMDADVSIAPYCWQFAECNNIVQVMTMSDSAADGSAFVQIICDVNHKLYGRCIFYVYRRDRLFHWYKKSYSFGHVLTLLKNANVKNNGFIEFLSLPGAENDVSGIIAKEKK